MAPSALGSNLTAEALRRSSAPPYESFVRVGVTEPEMPISIWAAQLPLLNARLDVVVETGEVMTLVGEEQYPSYVDTVLKAIDAAGLDAKSASGYRGYYESKKKENPSWPGVPMRPDQDFVIVVGPKPAA